MFTALQVRLDRVVATLLAHPLRVAAVVVMAAVVQISPLWFATPDSSCYMSIARTMWSPDGPTNLGDKHLYFSPFYPLVLSPTFLISDKPFVWIGLIHWLLTALLTVGIARWARPFGPAVVLVAAVGTIVHTLFGLSVRRPLSETTFMTAMVWTVLVLEQIRTSDDRRCRIRYGLLGTVMLIVTCLTRPNGVALLPGFGLAMLAAARGDRSRLVRNFIVAATIGLVAGGVFIASRKIDDRRAVAVESYTYWDQLIGTKNPDGTLFQRLPNGLLVQLYDFQRVIVPGMFKTRSNSAGIWNINTPIALAMAGLVTLGWWTVLRPRGDVWSWTFPCYLMLNVLWAADAGTRYTLPVMPVVLASAWLGLTRIVGEVRSHRLLIPFLVLHIVAHGLFWLGVDLPKHRELNRHWDAVARLCSQVDVQRQSTGALGLSPEQIQYFRFTLDRPVNNLSLMPDVRPEAHDWIATPFHAAAPPGFVAGPIAEPYRLWRRQAPAN